MNLRETGDGKVLHETIPFPSSRRFTMDIGKLGLKKHHVKLLLEVDVTQARKWIAECETAEKQSFTAWILRCISQAISEHKAVHALRAGRDKIIVFEDIDISVVVERAVHGQKVPLPIVIRNVNNKKMRDIEQEIRSAKNQEITDEKDYVLGENAYKWATSFFIALPQCLRLFLWRRLLQNPFSVKKMMGTVLVTSVGMVGNVKGWVIPVGIHPISFAFGSVINKPGVHEGEIGIREYLPMTILIDHDVVDGGPAARFASRLTELMESGYGLVCPE